MGRKLTCHSSLDHILGIRYSPASILMFLALLCTPLCQQEIRFDVRLMQRVSVFETPTLCSFQPSMLKPCNLTSTLHALHHRCLTRVSNFANLHGLQCFALTVFDASYTYFLCLLPLIIIGVSRMTTSMKRKHRDRVVRRGLGLIVESDFYTTPAGRAHFANQLQSIRVSCTPLEDVHPPLLNYLSTQHLTSRVAFRLSQYCVQETVQNKRIEHHTMHRSLK